MFLYRLLINILILKFRYSISNIGSSEPLLVLLTFNVFGFVTNVSTGGVPSNVVAAVFLLPK
jgi:hypothetical protein